MVADVIPSGQQVVITWLQKFYCKIFLTAIAAMHSLSIYIPLRLNGLRMFRYFTIRYLYMFATYTCSLPTFSPPIHFRYPAFSLPGTILAIHLSKDT